MRTVQLFKYEMQLQKPEEIHGPRKMVRVPDGTGTFHAWGVEYEELGETGVGNYSVAIVELPGGAMKTAPVHMIEFIDQLPE